MTIAMNNPMKSRPVLRLKSSSPPLDPVPAAPKPTPPPKPAPAAEPLAAAPLPPSISKKAARKIAAANMRRELVLKFPECFKGYGVKRPLKIKIHEDILVACPGFDRRTLSDALRSYVSRGGYREGLIEGATRIDLEGKPAGVVEPHQVQKPKTVSPEKE
jgi:ProP effector